MSALSDRLQTELDEDDQLASLRVEYTFEGERNLEGAGTYYEASRRSGEGRVAVRFFDLEGAPALQGLDATQTIEQRPLARVEQRGSDETTAGEGLGEISNAVRDPEGDSIDGSIAAAAEPSEASTLPSFQLADLDGGELLGRFSHPNLVETVAVRRGRRTLAVVTEMIDGHALSQHVYDGALRGKPDRAAVVARDLARALGYMHERGVLHLDVKPENVLRDSTGDVRLLNAGVTPLIESGLEEGRVRGTPGYVPPERIDSDDDRLGPWSDLYSLGVLLYHATTGRAPFSGTDADETIRQQIHEPPPAPRTVNSKISPFLERVIQRLMAREPEDRYRSADELEWDLTKYLDQPASERFGVRRKPRVWEAGLSAAGGVFFGRRDEMETVTRHLTAEEERPRVAVVRGSRGVGKSALLEGQIERLERQQLGPVYARAAGDIDSVAAVVMLARGAVQTILESSQFDTDAWRAHFQDASPAARSLVGRIPRLGRLLPGGGSSKEPSDDNRRALMRNVIAWRDLFELLISGPDEFTWIVDDLHRLGELTGEILAEFIHRRDDLSSRWILSQSPGENPNGDEWIEEHVVGADAAVEILGLESLNRGQIRGYFKELLHASEDVFDRFVDRLVGVSGGRPELIQIALQQLTSSGAIEFRAGKLRLDGDTLEQVDLAEDLVEYALEAWDDLSDDEQELAYNVALLGDCIPAALLLEIASVEGDEFEEQLAALVSRRILEVTPATHARLVSCSEQTVREFVRKQLTPSEFERRHRMLAFECTDHFELSDEDRFDDGWLCVNVAQQWVAAGEPERAVDWLARGGRIRLTEGRVSNALRLMREAEERTETPFEIRVDGLSLVELLGDTLAAAGQGAEAVEQYESALEASREFEERQRLRLKLGRGLQQRLEYNESYRLVADYLEERQIEVPATEERLAFSLIWLFLKYLVLRAAYRLGILSTRETGYDDVSRELDNFEATQILAYNLRQHDNWSPLIWLTLSSENRAHSQRDSRVLAVNLVGHARMCTEAPWPMPGRAASFRDMALEQLQMSDDDRVRSYVGATAAQVSMRLGDHEQAVELARRHRAVTVSEGAFADYQNILETLIYLALYSGNLDAADQLINRFVADARAFGTYEVAHVTNYFEAYVEFLKGNYGEARKHLGKSRSANQRAQDATCVALQDWIDFELLWRYGQRREALATAREAVDNIEGELRDDTLNETICRAARLASRAALEAREGNLQEDPWELLQFAERCCDLAVQRTKSFPTLRSMARCEQGRLAWMRDDDEEAIGRLDQAVLAAETFGQIRFQAAAYELRSHVHAEASPFHALADARRARALFEMCEFSEAVDRLDEAIDDLLETRSNLDAFGQGFRTRIPEPAELEPSKQARNPLRTIELSPEAEEVEVMETDETLRPWEGENSGVKALVPPSPEGEEPEERAEPPAIGEEEAPEPIPEDDEDDRPMPPSPDKSSLDESSSAESDSLELPTPGAPSGGDDSDEDEEPASSDEGETSPEPPTLPNPEESNLEAIDADEAADEGGDSTGEGAESVPNFEAPGDEDEADEEEDSRSQTPAPGEAVPEGASGSETMKGVAATIDEDSKEKWQGSGTKKGVPSVPDSAESGEDAEEQGASDGEGDSEDGESLRETDELTDDEAPPPTPEDSEASTDDPSR